MKQLISILLFLVFSSFLQAQNFRVSGKIKTETETDLSGATVVLLSAQDSTLQHFKITEDDGIFSFPKVKSDKYILQISYLGYETYNEDFDLKADKQFEIELQEESKLLDEVTVAADRIPIQLKGDTIEYNAAAFETKPNAVVEDLLKKLPGVEVDRNGQIKAQGEGVTKVLVDGKEFFGNDAKIATQNLPADAIDKVQVFDKKSDTAEFTGVDDGERDKTINLTLKEDKKNGYFGNISAGYGTDNRYRAKGNLNRFSPDMQLSAIGNSNNINEQSFGLQDYLDFMGGMGALMSGSMSINPAELGISFSNDGRKTGFADTHSGGLNLNYNFSKKTKFHLNYFYNQLKSQESRTATRQNLLGTSSVFETQQMGDKLNQNQNHRANAEFEHKIDSTQDLKLRTDFIWNDNTLMNTSFSETFNTNGAFENSSRSDYNSSGKRINFKSKLTYRKRLGKAGRAFVGTASIGQLQVDALSDLNSINSYLGFADSILQEQIRENTQFNYRTKLTYTEPIGKNKHIQISYGRQDFADNLTKDFFDLKGRQRLRNTSLSNRFTKDYIYDRVGTKLQWNKKKSKLSLGLDAQNAKLQGNTQGENMLIERDFLNLLPSLQWQYDISSAMDFSFRYTSNIEAPNLEQLQPIVDNSDPLNVYIGNPDLEAEYRHNFSTNFSLFDQFSFTNLFTYFNFTYTENKITNKRNIDSLLRQEIRPVNVDNDLMFMGSLNFGTPIRPIKCKINLDQNFQYNRSILFVNDLENQVNRWNGEVNVSLENRKKKIVDAIIGGGLGYNSTNYSISTAQNQSFLTQTYFTDLSWDIGEKWNLSSSCDFTIYTADAFNPQESVAIWQASLSHYIGKAQRWEVKASAFDLLNQNVGINRNSSANFVQSEQIRSLGRYFMLSLAYSIKGFGEKE